MSTKQSAIGAAVAVVLVCAGFASVALEDDSQTPDEATAKKIADSFCAQVKAKEKCAVCGQGDQTPDVLRVFEGQFLPDRAPDLIAEVRGCRSETSLLLHLQRRDGGLKLMSISNFAQLGGSPSYSLGTCKRLRPKDPSKVQDDVDPGGNEGRKSGDVLICRTQTPTQGANGRFEVVRVQRDDGIVSRPMFEYADQLAGCTKGRFYAARPVDWRVWQFPGSDRQPRIAILFKRTSGTIPEHFEDACDAAENDGFAPWEGASHHAVIYEFEYFMPGSAGADAEQRYRTRLSVVENDSTRSFFSFDAFSYSGAIEWFESSNKFGGMGLKGAGPGGEIGDDTATEREQKEESEAQPQVELSMDGVEGGLAAEIVHKVIRQHRRELKYCYEQQWLNDKSLSGTVEFQMTVGPKGDVIAALVNQSSLESRAAEQCMQKKIKRWAFPAPKGDQRIAKIKFSADFRSEQSP